MYTNNENVISDINVTPFIDILLVLLIVFVVAVVSVFSEVFVNLPPSSSQKPLTKQDMTVNITIKQDGIYIKDAKYDKEEFENYLKQASKESIMKIYGDRDVPYSKVVSVLDSLSKANLNKISLVTKVAEG